MSVYINPYTDFGFKKLFGEPTSKDFLIDFLNQVLPAHHAIADLVIENPENLDERRAFFDIHCTAVSGERFMVGMQKANPTGFKDRTLFNLTYPVLQQMQISEQGFQFRFIYFITLLDFYYEADTERAKFRRDVQWKDQDDKVVLNKLSLVFLQMPVFKKTAHELETQFDKWCYFLNNLSGFSEIPQILSGDSLFQQAFETAKYANLSPTQQKEYETSRLIYFDTCRS